MDKEIKAKVKELESKGWIEIAMIFEVLGTNKEIVEKSLREHIEKIERIKTCFLYEKNFSKIDKVEKPLPKVEEGYSQYAEVKCLIKNLETLFVISISYGPSSIEIIKPKKIEVSAGELQNVANLVAGIIHKIAEAGLGGIVATPKS